MFFLYSYYEILFSFFIRVRLLYSCAPAYNCVLISVFFIRVRFLCRIISDRNFFSAWEDREISYQVFFIPVRFLVYFLLLICSLSTVSSLCVLIVCDLHNKTTFFIRMRLYSCMFSLFASLSLFAILYLGPNVFHYYMCAFSVNLHVFVDCMCFIIGKLTL